jgi:ATP-dependent DNA helicase DinG
MLTEQEKHLLRDGLRRLAANMRGYRERREQLRVMGAVALAAAAGAGEDACDGANIAVVEAPTGTGKSAALALSAAVMAHTRGKRLVMSSCTVALMEQLRDKDLPLIAQSVPFPLRVAVAKGRQRYACIVRLADAEQPALRALAEDFAAGRWNGDVDALSEPVTAQQWQSITNDEAGCLGKACRHRTRCPYLVARDEARSADVLITNHHFVAAALQSEEAAGLPDLRETIAVFDEAHALPETALHALTRSFAPRAVAAAVGDMPELAQRIARGLRLPPAAAQAVAIQAGPLAAALRELDAACLRLIGAPAAQRTCLPAGPLPQLAPALQALREHGQAMLEALQPLREAVLERAAQEPQAAERVVGWMAPALRTLRNALHTCAMFGDERGAQDEPPARWIETGPAPDAPLQLNAAPLSSAPFFAERLWTQVCAAVTASATLRACGSFEPFLRESGLHGLPRVRTMALPSPFRHHHLSTLLVPQLAADPRDAQAHTAEVLALLPELIHCQGTLVLFCSATQMQAVRAALPEHIASRILMQGELGKAALLREHRRRIERGEVSIIFGLASFFEGVDLPGRLLEHVIIAKLPFRPPGEPIEQARAAAMAAQRRSYFEEVALPEVSLRLQQAAGRLIRSDTDRGTVTILDRRIGQTHWGRRLLAGLPPMRKYIGATDWRRVLPAAAFNDEDFAAHAAEQDNTCARLRAHALNDGHDVRT